MSSRMTAWRRAFMRLSRQIIHRFLLIQHDAACISILFDAYCHASRIVSAKVGGRDHDTRGRCRRDWIHRARAPPLLVPSSVRLSDGGDVGGHDVEKAAGAGAPVERRNYAALPGDVARGRRCLSGAARTARARTWAGTPRTG